MEQNKKKEDEMEKISTGIKWINEGIEEEYYVERYHVRYPYDDHVTRIIGYPTAKGKKSEEYMRIKRDLGDDFVSDISDSWFDAKYPHHLVLAIDAILRSISHTDEP